MNNQELRESVLQQIKNNKGKIPLTIILDNKRYNWNGGQRIGQNQLIKYRLSSEIYHVRDEKQILIPLSLISN